MKSSFQNAPNVCLSTEKRLVSNAHDVVEIVKSLKTLGAKIVLTQGSYDLVHIGVVTGRMYG